MRVSLKKAFSLLDGRLSTNIGDVYEMLNFIFDDNFFTHQLPRAMDKLKEVNPTIPIHINNSGEACMKELITKAKSGSFITILSDTIDNAIDKVTFYLDKELDKK